MANQYVNKVVQSNGTTLIDITDTTAVAEDVAQGKYFYLSSGQRVEGTASGGGNEWTSGIYQDNDGYIRISPLPGAGGVTLSNGYLVLAE